MNLEISESETEIPFVAENAPEFAANSCEMEEGEAQIEYSISCATISSANATSNETTTSNSIAPQGSAAADGNLHEIALASAEKNAPRCAPENNNELENNASPTEFAPENAEIVAENDTVSRDDLAELARSYAPDYVFLEDLKHAESNTSGALGFLQRRRLRKIEETANANADSANADSANANANAKTENAPSEKKTGELAAFSSVSSTRSAVAGVEKPRRAPRNFHDKSRERRERHARKRVEKNLNMRRDDVWQSERLPLTFAARIAIRLAPLYGAFYDWQMTRGQGVREIRQRLSLPRFPAQAAPLKIAFVSDFHYGPTSGRTAARQAWKIARDARPDVLLLGGDFLYADERGLPALLRELQRWKRDRPPGGMFACLGNHDYEAGADTLVMALEACGVRVLINESVELPEPWRGVHIVGSDDEWHGDAQPDEAVAALPENDCAILLAHSPDVCEHDAIRHCDLALCGHTHGGQICLPNGEAPHLPAGWVKDFPWGLHRHAGTWLFVSRGVGTVFFPLRMFAPPDVAVFELNRAGGGKSGGGKSGATKSVR